MNQTGLLLALTLVVAGIAVFYTYILWEKYRPANSLGSHDVSASSSEAGLLLPKTPSPEFDLSQQVSVALNILRKPTFENPNPKDIRLDNHSGFLFYKKDSPLEITFFLDNSDSSECLFYLLERKTIHALVSGKTQRVMPNSDSLKAIDRVHSKGDPTRESLMFFTVQPDKETAAIFAISVDTFASFLEDTEAIVPMGGESVHMHSKMDDALVKLLNNASE